jgi:hypothetical protein
MNSTRHWVESLQFDVADWNERLEFFLLGDSADMEMFIFGRNSALLGAPKEVPSLWC